MRQANLFLSFEAYHRVDAISCHGCLASATGGSIEASEPCLQLLSKFFLPAARTVAIMARSEVERSVRGMGLVELVAMSAAALTEPTVATERSRDDRGERANQEGRPRADQSAKTRGPEDPTWNARQLSEGPTLSSSRKPYHVHVYNLAILLPRCASLCA